MVLYFNFITCRVADPDSRSSFQNMVESGSGLNIKVYNIPKMNFLRNFFDNTELRYHLYKKKLRLDPHQDPVDFGE